MKSNLIMTITLDSTGDIEHVSLDNKGQGLEQAVQNLPARD